jgi:integrase
MYDFYREYFVPVCLSRVEISTKRVYQQVVDFWIAEVGNHEIREITPLECQKFVDAALEKVSPETVAKYCRHINALFLRMGPPGWRNRQAFGFVQYPPYCAPPKLPTRLPKLVSDRDIIKLIDALTAIENFPKAIDEKLRPVWWRTLVLFVVTTAVRKEVVFGLKWDALDLHNQIFFVTPELDKANKERLKFLHPNLSRLLLKLRTADPRVFVWTHGDKKFYTLWNQAIESVGLKLTLHDLKRYASQLALRSGANVATLQEFCDHADITTTLKHYARGEVASLIPNLKLPPEVWND